MDETMFAAKAEEVEKSMAAIGLYMSGHQWMTPGDHSHDEDPDYVEPDAKHAVLMARFDLGDIAFSTRVLDPDQVEWDKEFLLMAAGDKQRDFRELQKELRGETDETPE